MANHIQASIKRRELRKTNLPAYSYPKALPVSEKHDLIADTIKQNQITLVSGETGSGKTTQLPKICLQAGRGLSGFIGHTQPRRIAARSIASRLAEELKTEVGQKVGMKVRFQDNSSQKNYIKVMTDGILLSEMQQDRWLNQYDTIIIDEAHERSLNIDFLLGYLKQLCRKRKELKLVITSATIDTEAIANHFDKAPVINVSGRTYPVDIRYHCADRYSNKETPDLYRDVSDALDELATESTGDTLVFLPGEREIRTLSRKLRHMQGRTDVLPLYARLPPKEQQRIFKTSANRRVILSTNVAETSLTVPGIRNVIDSGLVRMSRYSWRSKVQRLPIEKTSQASANQRAGRCGRLGPGICYRLYDEDDFHNRSAFTDPEILRTNLATVLLQMAHLRLGKIEDFPFLDQPDTRLVRDGLLLLKELTALDDNDHLTPIGKQLAVLPIDPRLGRMILAARDYGVETEVMIIATAIATGDPRDRPMDKQQAADQSHAEYADKKSDFISLLNLWNVLHQQSEELTHSAFRRYCQRSFIHFRRYREWKDLFRQMKRSIKHQPPSTKKGEPDHDAIHQSILSGLLDQVGTKNTKGEYEGVRNRRFKIHPGSVTAKKQPKWIMSAELVETTQLYARLCAVIQPLWIEKAAGHIIREDYSEPYWQDTQGRVAGFAKLSLYGLVIVPRKRINYAAKEPGIAREIFIRQGLVEGRLNNPPELIKNNLALTQALQDQEAKIRRRDILIEDEILFEFYDQRLPEDINTTDGFTHWLASHKDSKSLQLTEQQIIRDDASSVKASLFPDFWVHDGIQLPMSYSFEPGSDCDGVTLTVPLPVLPQINSVMFEWLMPGLLEEKILALLRSLPKAVRKQFVPAPDYARAVYEVIANDAPAAKLTETIASKLFSMTGNQIPTDSWQTDAIERHLHMRYRIVDEQGVEIEAGRDLEKLKKTLHDRIDQTSQSTSTAVNDFEQYNCQTWCFGDLPATIECQESGYQIRRYPAIIDNGKSVDLRLLATAKDAEQHSRNGITRLLILALHKEVKYATSQLPNLSTLCLQFHSLADCKHLTNDILKTAMIWTFFSSEALPKTESDYRQLLEDNRAQFISNATAVCDHLANIQAPWKAVQDRIKGNLPLAWIEACSDIKKQLDGLVYVDFLQHTDRKALKDIPRYLKAILRRIDTLERAPDKDRIKRIQIEPLYAKLDPFSDEKIRTNAALNRYRWSLEELRISLFAQDIGTKDKVSIERLNKLWKATTQQA